MTKILLAVGGAALICGGAVMTYLNAQTPMSMQDELTLANLEAMANELEDNSLDIDYDIIKGDGARGRCWGLGDCFEELGQQFPGEWLPRV